MARPRRDTIRIRHWGDAAHAKRPWSVTWRETKADGTRGPVFRFFETEAEAQAFKVEAEADAASLPPVPPMIRETAPVAAAVATVRTKPRVLFRAFAEEWLRDIAVRRKPATHRSYAELLKNHVYPHIGTVPVRDLDIQTLVHVIAEATAAGASWGLQKAILRVLSTCLRWAVRYQHLTTNPALGLCKELKDDSRPEYADPEPNPLTPEQCERFLTWVRTGRLPGKPADYPVDGPKLRGGQLRTEGYPEWYPYFLTLARTGMRRGEAAALKWSTVHLDRTPPRARLEQSYSPSARAAAEHQTDGDISLKGKRPHEIDLAADVVEVLRALARTRREDALKHRRTMSPYVFLTPRGARVLSDSGTAERIFARGMTALDLARHGHTLHDLRDTFATSHLSQDPARLFWVSWMLGHRQTSTTLNRYTKWVPQTVGNVSYASALGDKTPAQALADAVAEAKGEAGTDDEESRK